MEKYTAKTKQKRLDYLRIKKSFKFINVNERRRAKINCKISDFLNNEGRMFYYFLSNEKFFGSLLLSLLIRLAGFSPSSAVGGVCGGIAALPSGYLGGRRRRFPRFGGKLEGIGPWRCRRLWSGEGGRGVVVWRHKGQLVRFARLPSVVKVRCTPEHGRRDWWIFWNKGN